MNINLYNREVQNWIKEIQRNRGIDPNCVLNNCDKLEEYGEKTRDDALIGYACFSRAETYYLLNDVKNFYNQMQKCLPSMERIGEWGYVVMANNLLGIMSLNRGDAPFAMDYYLKALSYCEKYNLPQLEWIVHMNIGSLYLNISEYEKALNHLESGYSYIVTNPKMDGYTEHLTTVYLGMAKAYLCLSKDQASQEFYIKTVEYNNHIENECKANLQRVDRLVVLCFQARLYHESKKDDRLETTIAEIAEILQEDIPIMDVFDDLYEYMTMLLMAKRYDDFIECFKKVAEFTKRTNIKNLQKKLLSILTDYYKAIDDKEKYRDTTVRFFEVSKQMEREDGVLVSSMINMRNSLTNLAKINWEVEQENIALHRKSETDALTGLYNRFRLNEYGEEAFMTAYDNGLPLAIEILDIDYFKEYNDNYGHQAGDEVLKIMAHCLIQMQNKGNVFCSRYGGDEFVLVYYNMAEQETYEWSKELRQMIKGHAVEHKFSKAADVLTISQGICWDIPKDSNKVWDFLHQADEYLYRVKKVSRDSICLGRLDGVERFESHEG